MHIDGRSFSAQVASLNRVMAIRFQVRTGGRLGATSGPINCHSISDVGGAFLKCRSQRLSVKSLSTTTSQNALLRGLSQTHGLRNIRAVTWSPIRGAAAPFRRRLLISHTIICDISLNCLNTLSILQSLENTLDARGI